MTEEKNNSSADLKGDEDIQIVRYAQLGLRLLGIMLLVDGSAGLASNLVFDAFFDSSIDYPADASKASRWSGFFMYGIYIFSGLYFVMDGKWVIDNVFTPKVRRDPE